MALIGLAGCAATVQLSGAPRTPSAGSLSVATPSPGMARIVVLRDARMFGAAVGFIIADAGREIGTIGPGGVLEWDRAGGVVAIEAYASNVSSVTLQADSGAVHFLEARPHWGTGFNTAAAELKLLSVEAGEALYAKLIARRQARNRGR